MKNMAISDRSRMWKLLIEMKIEINRLHDWYCKIVEYYFYNKWEFESQKNQLLFNYAHIDIDIILYKQD